MQFKGRNLATGASGHDVAEVHGLLRHLGFSVEATEIDEAVFGTSTAASVSTFQRINGLTVSGVVDEETYTAMLRVRELSSTLKQPRQSETDITITGMITLANHMPSPGALIRIVAQSLRSLRPLAETRTDADGAYTARINRQQLHSEGTLDDGLVVQALDAQERQLAQSPPYFRVGATITINLEIPAAAVAPPTEFERVRGAVTAALGATSITDISRDQIEFIARQTQLPVVQVDALVHSERGATQAQVPAAFLYACARQGLSAQLLILAQAHDTSIEAACMQAATDGQIPALSTDEIKAALAQLRQFQAAAVLAPSSSGQTATSGDLLALALPDQATRQGIAGLAVMHGLDTPDFWKAVQAQPGITANQVSDLQFAFELADLTSQYLPLIQYVVKAHLAGSIGAVRDLAQLDVAAWEKILLTPTDGKTVGTPAGTPGATPAEQAQAYATTLTQTLAAAYPTTVFAARLTREGLPGKEQLQADLGRFLTQHPDFDLGTDPITRYVASNPDALKGIANPQDFVSQAASVQRVFRISPNYDHVKVLLPAGLDSAQKIARVARSTFLQRFQQELGTGAAMIYNSAAQIAAITVHLFTQENLRRYENTIPSLQDSTVSVSAGQLQEELLGSLDFCGCEDCRSVLSPAAYLTDLLAWLANRPSSLSSSALDVLLDRGNLTTPDNPRRPDLAGIELSCINTNTPLPYIDLVNEILEQAVANPGTLPPGLPVPQTTLSADELSVTPEHVIEGAYTTLAQQSYPLSLPFDLHTTEAEIFLQGMGTSREALLVATFAGDKAAARADSSVSQETLGISAVAWSVLTTVTPTQPWALWGISGATVSDPGGSGTTIDWWVALRYVPVFLQQSGIAYTDLLALLRTTFMQPGGTPAFTLDPDSPCTLDTAKLHGLDATGATRAHRFLRQWRVMGGSIDDLDLLLAALNITEITPDALTTLAAVKRLRALLPGLRTAQVAAFWANLSTRLPPDGSLSFYDQLFQNPAISSPVNPAFALNGTRTELATPAGTISGANAATVQAALSISGGDLAAILQPAGPVPDQMALANLSAIVRTVTLAHALHLNIADLLALMPLMSISPFDGTHVGDAVTWIETAQAVQASRFTIPQVRWLTEGIIPASVTAQLSDAAITAQLTTLQGNLQTAPAGSDTSQIVKSVIWPLVGFPATYPITLLSDLAQPAGGGAPDMLTYLLQLNGGGLTPAAALPSIRRLQAVSLLASTLHLTGNDLPYLFNRSGGATLVAGLGWLDPNALPASPIAADPARLMALLRLVAGVQLCAGLSCTLQQLFSLFTFNGSKDNALSLIASFTPWPLSDLQTLAGTAGDGPLALPYPSAYQDERGLLRLEVCFDLMKALNITAARLLSWAITPVTASIAADIRAAARAGFTSEQAWITAARPWQESLRERQRDALVGYLLGQRQSGDLTAQVDTTTLIDEYLIDVSMSACMMTSRIKQAISSTQLFIQRAMMHMEPLVTFADEDQQQWLWMKNYRVWEANRKVFLYPEDWIVPELRDDKSPFFKDLENALLQSEVTNDSAEAALMDYLTSLYAVSRLEICGFYHQLEKDENGQTTINTIHVIGRTHGTPQTYYYRRYVDSSYWTAWEKVSLTIKSNHIVPIIYNRRLRLCWVTIKAVNDPDAPTSSSSSGSSTSQAQPPMNWALTINWSDYQQGKWSTPASGSDPSQQLQIHKTSSRDYELGRTDTVDDESLFFFQGFIDNGDLVIRCNSYSQQEQIDGGSVVSAYTYQGDFRFAACMGILSAAPAASPTAQTYYPPTGAADVNQTFALSSPGMLHTYPPDLSILGALPVSNPTIAYAHQFLNQPFPAPFFLSDDQRSFFAMPVYVRPSRWGIIFPLFPFPLLPGTNGPAPLPVPISPNPNPIADGSYSQDVLNALRADAQQVTSVVVTNPSYRYWNHYQFSMAYHPWICTFVEELERGGLDALYRRWVQVAPYILNPNDDHLTFFHDDYVPNPAVVTPYPVADVDFRYQGAYSLYDWELFYHVPMLIAARLTSNQQFEDALRWLERIFDPNDTSPLPVPHRFWKTRPFFDAGAAPSIQGLLALLDTSNPADDDARNDLISQITQWRKYPFNPHLIARLRTSAYQKATIMQYLDTLIAWGDQLFNQDTIETINQATQLYLAAAAILGPRPPTIPAATPPADQTFAQIQTKLDQFSNALLGLETLLPSTDTPSVSVGVEPVPAVTPIMYFCLPPNAKLLSYWDTLADRLFKVRHCQNIAGVAQQLPLFEPPIDPALLVAATAAGLSIADVLNDILAPPPLTYRFDVMIKRAHEVAASVSTLGAKLLTALERRDAANLTLLRSSNELSLLALIRDVKSKHVDEAQQIIDALTASQQIMRDRASYYRGLPLTIIGDAAAGVLKLLAIDLELAAAGVHVGAAVAHAAPNASAGTVAIAPTASVTDGGTNAGHAGDQGSKATLAGAAAAKDGADVIRWVTDDVRKVMDWNQKASESDAQADQIGKQIIAAQTRHDIAQKELDNFDQQIAQTQAVDDFYHNQFTNADLYGWMVGQVSALYFQSYQVAHSLAKQAEQTFRLELGLYDGSTPPFITFGYWDSLYKGLLAGERLQLDLHRMEAAYYQRRQRVYEITKKVSLKTHAPEALATLLSNGSCYVSLGEDLFDADYPTHYLRRTTLVNLGITFKTPYDPSQPFASTINCTLTLAQDKIRTQPGRAGDPDVTHNTAQSMVASTALTSYLPSNSATYAGMFTIDFLKDERFFPFEGSGAISDWHISMPPANNSLDFSTITDVWLQIKYTALGAPVIGGDPLIVATP